MNKAKLSIFIFRRDFRLNDNIGLLHALQNSYKVIPIFIFSPEQIIKNEYKSNNCIQFMIESLESLNNELKEYKSKLFYFFGRPSQVIQSIIKNNDINSVYVNMDYTPYSHERDNDIKNICNKNNCEFYSYEDILLNDVNSIKTVNEQIYTKFTPYFNKAKKIKIKEVFINNYSNYVNNKFKFNNIDEYNDIHKFYKYNDHISVIGGREYGLKILKNLKNFNKYNTERNILSVNTTKLSAYIKFGCVSIREVYYSFLNILGSKNDLIKQLYWRDFYYNVGYNYPHVIHSNNRNFRLKYKKVKWYNVYKNDKIKFMLWCEGKTGYPIVDACMRELNITGYMHNRGRLIVSNFLTKLLLWDWQDGEKYFAQKLIDYDPLVNNGNWQWSAGSGVDAQPYFRIFNPWHQSIKFDNDCIYIKKWLPELKNVQNNHIHKWFEYYDDYNVNYPKPIINYEINRKKCLKLFKNNL